MSHAKRLVYESRTQRPRSFRDNQGLPCKVFITSAWMFTRNRSDTAVMMQVVRFMQKAIPATRFDLDRWMKTLNNLRTGLYIGDAQYSQSFGEGTDHGQKPTQNGQLVQ